MSTFALRTADAGDAGAIAALHTANWRCAYAGILDPAYLDARGRPVRSQRAGAGPSAAVGAARRVLDQPERRAVGRTSPSRWVETERAKSAGYM